METTVSPVGRRAPALDYPVRLLALVAAVVMMAAPIGYLSVHRNNIYPGVRLAGVHLGGRAPVAALALLPDHGLDEAAPITLRADTEVWRLSPAQVGVALDSRQSVEDAFAVGRGARSMSMLEVLLARLRGRDVAVRVAFDPERAEAALAELADAFDRPASEAGFQIDGLEVVPLPGAPGRALNARAGVDALAAAVAAGRWPLDVTLPTSSIPPLAADPGPGLEAARQVLAAPVSLRYGDRTWEVPVEALAGMLESVLKDGRPTVAVDSARLADWLAPIAVAVAAPAANPRFHMNPDDMSLVLVAPGTAGVTVDVDATAAALVAGSRSQNRTAPLVVAAQPPDVPDDARAADLGLTHLLRQETSYFRGSPAARIHNIDLSAARFDGVLIPPGAIASFNELVGEIRAEDGYKETLIIMDGTTAEGVGGGVCQTSTTFFRAAFWAGLPITERHAHGYRVAYYEQGPKPVGLDATIYRPVVDLKFQNDTPGWILVETVTDSRAATLTFRFWGTDTGREVELVGPRESRHVQPPAERIVVDPALAPGATERLEHARSGSTVSLERVIRQGDEERRDTFVSNYRPTGSVIAVGPDPQAAPAP